MELFEQITASVSSFLWGWPMIILLLGTHIFLTIRLKFPQRKIFTAIRLSFKKDPDSEGDVSQFGALATSLAATIGTGNIIGVATAVAFGGPGAVFWCWLTGVFGIATKYAWWSDVRTGTRTEAKMAGHFILHLYSHGSIRYRKYGTS